MKRLTLSVMAILLSAVCAVAQNLADCRREFALDEIEGLQPREKGETPQGLAIYDGVMFALCHGGRCAAIDMPTRSLLGEFILEGAEGTHCNNASFGIERADSLSRFPLLYVSECYAPCRCFVEEITEQGSRLVATIIYTGSGIDSFCDWFVDGENRRLYAYGRTPDKGVVLKRFALPTLADADDEGIIRLGDCDVLREFVYPAGYFSIPQGSHIAGGMIYLPTGVPRLGSCMIHVLSDEDGARTALHDITDIGLEPEGLCMYEGRLWQFFGGGSGTVYSFAAGQADKKL